VNDADAGTAPSGSTRAEGAGVAPNVLAALQAAARSEPHEDDLHPATARTGRALSPLQAIYDVRHYHLELTVRPQEYSIDGRLTMTFTALEPLTTIELDLDPDLSIHGAASGVSALEVARNEDRFTVALDRALAAGERAEVSIEYGGQPHVALAPPWHGGFVWAQVDGRPWFATAVQTEGCDLWWPCKDSFADKPEEGVAVSITAPASIAVASIGRLDRVEEAEAGWKTWHWVSRHPYTGYAVAINGGPLERIEAAYEGINGTTYPVEFWALEGNVDKARALIESDVKPDLAFFERLLGPYPWGDEKVGFVETPHLGMEHQTINGYGEQYERGAYGFDGLLHHELAHEWFGNLMTHARPEDAWLHEGYGAYMQAVYAEETVGRMGYYDHLYAAYTSNEHCAAVVDSSVEDVGEAFDNRDIYTKGAWLLHTVRRHIGEEAFWRATRRLLYGTAEPWDLTYPIQTRYRSTEDFIRLVSDEAGEDLAWLVEAVLLEAAMPKLAVTRADGQARLAWQAPGNRPFPMPVTVSIDGERRTLDMADGSGTVTVPEGARFIVDPDSAVLRDLPIIGDCEEQTDEQIEHNLERFTRMAGDYGWLRP
jgi:aminopeptidase N